ncbi:type II toxin-antitoxin system TacA family antitoxin [Marinobacter subterrani]|uniref:Putative conserved protein, DUF1778 family n=1 Tax=Marinobacter subterrani TaxID=1658765 RepID=A0A0J7J929_9GAMM|nr:DUF1778 domain-containing protein [Marinobacter subterrani]KMQ74401.1 putative conserved protein, DUF1778 family [Marinobacter subterrani]
MAKPTVKLTLELTASTELLLARASESADFKTLTAFIERAAVEKALQILDDTKAITLDSESFEAFIASCESPAPPNDTLKFAFQGRTTKKDISQLDENG